MKTLVKASATSKPASPATRAPLVLTPDQIGAVAAGTSRGGGSTTTSGAQVREVVRS